MQLKVKDIKEGVYYWALEKSRCGAAYSKNEPELVHIQEKIRTELRRLSVSQFDYYFADGCIYPNHISDWKFLQEVKIPKGQITKLKAQQEGWSLRECVEDRYYSSNLIKLKQKDLKQDSYYWAVEKARKWNPQVEIVYVYQSSLTRLSVTRMDCFFDIDSSAPNHPGDWHFLEELKFPKTGEVAQAQKSYDEYMDKKYGL